MAYIHDLLFGCELVGDDCIAASTLVTRFLSFMHLPCIFNQVKLPLWKCVSKKGERERGQETLWDEELGVSEHSGFSLFLE